MMQSPADFERIACEAAQKGGDVLRRRFRESDALRVELKGRRDFVTEVDRQAEAAVLGYLRERCPGHVFMSEEESPEAEAAEYRWVLDPLDGTTNFIHGVTPFSVSIALEDGEGLVAAAILDPHLSELFHACRGGGARLNGEPIRCSRPDGLEHSLVATGFPFREMSRLDRYLQSFEAFVLKTCGIRRAGSAAIDLAYTACGRYDGFWEIGLSRWDVAAGTLLVREAGGRVTDPTGGEMHLDTGDIVAAGVELHGEMLEITRQAFG
jgi:myo-inositol-1(or 4)-monophosphatase